MKANVLDHRHPHHRHFEEMTRIPHGSYHEQEYSDYLVSFATKHNLRCKQDEMGNVIIYKNGSKGYEDHPAVMLQGHIDMVWEKNKDCPHNFETDPLKLYIKDGFLWANGTTLGADDGVGVSYMLSVLESTDIPHPPLECVFTVQEEVGLYGAFNIKKEDISAHRMIGLDDGGGISTCTTSAGGTDGKLLKKVPRTEDGGHGYLLTIGGLKGGHSGECIDKELGNSIKCCTRILMAIKDQGLVRICDLDGGLQDNAIPRECEVSFLTDLSEEQVNSITEKLTTELKKELEQSDPNLTVRLEPSFCEKSMTAEDSASIIDLLCVFPHGFRHKSLQIEGLTITSENLAAIHLVDDVFTLVYSLRAMYDSALDEMEKEIEIIARLFSCDTTRSPRYPSWEYREDSFVRKQLQKVFKEQTGQELILEAVHGGLECGVFSRFHDDMDIVTLGAIGLDVHTPYEHLDLASFDQTYELLLALLKEL